MQQHVLFVISTRATLYVQLDHQNTFKSNIFNIKFDRYFKIHNFIMGIKLKTRAFSGTGHAMAVRKNQFKLFKNLKVYKIFMFSKNK